MIGASDQMSGLTKDPSPAKRWLTLFVLIMISAGVYLNTLDNDFISDDKFQILINEWIKDWSNLGRILFSSVWDFSPGEGDSNYYRPVKYILYTFAYSLSALEPWGYHLIKIVLHAVNTLLLFYASLLLLSGRETESTPRLSLHPFYLSAIAAALFAAHPINTEAVSWIAAVPEVSFTLFGLVALIFYMKERYILTAVALFCSMLSKETAILLPLLFVGYDLTIRRVNVGDVTSHVKRYLPLAASVVLHLLMRWYALDGELFGLGGDGGESVPFLSTAMYIFNLPLLIGKYFGKLIIPTDISFFNYMNFTPARSFSEWRALLSVVITLVFLALFYWSWRRERRALFAFVWIFVPLLPVFALGLDGGMPLYESRYIYFAVPGYAFLLMLFMERAAALLASRGAPALWAAAVIVTILFSVGTVKRNMDWQSEFTLWRDSALKNPLNAPARVSYGVELAKRDRLDEALKEIGEGLRLNPRSTGAHNNIGIIYAKTGNIERAAREFSIAVRLDPENMEARRNLEHALKMLGGGGGGKR